MNNSKLSNLLTLFITALCLMTIPLQSQAATKGKHKAVQQVEKERVVLMPLRVPEEDKNLRGAMETALVEGLQQKYDVFSGGQVSQKAHQIFLKESRNMAHNECDETRCMQNIAEAFQAELIAIASVTKQDGIYFLALSIQNIFDDKVVYSKSSPCKNCDAAQVVEKLKELSGIVASVAFVPAAEEAQVKTNPNDPEANLWEEVKKGNAEEDYQTYLSQYPMGKFIALAKEKLNRLKKAARAATEQQDQQQDRQAWNTAQKGNTQDNYATYLAAYPNGQFAALIQGRIDKKKREAEAKQIGAVAARSPQLGKVYKDCADCPEVVMVPAGGFDMGSPNAEAGRNADESPVHHVNVQAFLMGKTHITRGQFAAFVSDSNYDAGNKCLVLDGKWQDRHGASWRKPGYTQQDNHPVACINWHDAKAYADWLSDKTGKAYRLPTEAEWEYAARAGTLTARYRGRSPDQACGYANVGDQTLKRKVAGITWETHSCTDGYAYTSPVASFQPNAFGLYDMQGNLWQWTADSYHDSYKGAPGNGSQWQGSVERVLRGGSWYSKPQRVRSAERSRNVAESRDSSSGFRIARTLP